jgi:hypothetical protein
MDPQIHYIEHPSLPARIPVAFKPNDERAIEALIVSALAQQFHVIIGTTGGDKVLVDNSGGNFVNYL